MQFEAELKQVKQINKASLDREYQLTFATSNPMVLDLGKLPFDKTFDIDINIHNDRARDNKS